MVKQDRTKLELLTQNWKHYVLYLISLYVGAVPFIAIEGPRPKICGQGV